jgi:hypothetical protein
MSQNEVTELEVMDAGGGALEQISRAEIDTQISTAKKYPRMLSKVRDNVLTLATMDEETAAACFFSLPRAGKAITGESVRLAEILASAYGNLRAAWRPINIDRQNGVVTCQGMCHDLENNISTSIEKSRKVQKKRNSNTYDEDMIMLAVNACGAIAYRDAVFKVVPKALIKPILKDIKEAARGKGTLDQKVNRVMDRLMEMGKEAGFKEKDFEKRVLATVEASKRADIDLTKLDTLIGVGTAIRDGEVRLIDAFPDPEAKPEGDPFQPKKPSAQSVEGNNEETADEGKAPEKEEAEPEAPESSSAQPSEQEGEPEPPKEEPKQEAQPTGRTAEPDEVSMLILESGGKATDKGVTKAAVALGILPKTYNKSVTEASPEQLGAIVDRWEEILKLKIS